MNTETSPIGSNGGDPVSPMDVLVALGILMANVLFQQRAILADVLSIEARTYRILRLLPFVAAVDAAGCLLSLVLYWQVPEQDIDNVKPKSTNALGPDRFEAEKHKRVVEAAPTIWTYSRLSTLFSKRSTLAAFAALELVKLTTCRGIHFGTFCGWAFFSSYILNVLAQGLIINSCDHREQASINSASLKSSNGRFPGSLRQWLQPFLIVALVFQFLQLAWLSQYFIPRRLWMDWGLPQVTVSNRSDLTFSIPPGMPPAPHVPGKSEVKLVVGYYPERTISGSVFYTINLVIFYLFLFSIPQMVVLGLPSTLLFLIWGGLLVAISIYTWDQIKLFIEKRPKIKEAVTRFDLFIHRRFTWPKWVQFCMWMIMLPVIIIAWLIFVVFLFGILMFPLLAVVDMLPLKAVWTNLRLDEFESTFVDKPEGSYATMTGVLIALSFYGVWTRGTAWITQKARSDVDQAEQIHLTSLFAIAMMTAFSGFYYRFCFNDKDTFRPDWVRLIP